MGNYLQLILLASIIILIVGLVLHFTIDLPELSITLMVISGVVVTLLSGNFVLDYMASNATSTPEPLHDNLEQQITDWTNVVTDTDVNSAQTNELKRLAGRMAMGDLRPFVITHLSDSFDSLFKLVVHKYSQLTTTSSAEPLIAELLAMLDNGTRPSDMHNTFVKYYRAVQPE